MHLIYGECGCNASAAVRLYRERYPNAERHPDYRVFVHMYQSYSEGRLPHVPKSGGRPQTDYEDMFLDEVENDAGTSVRAIEMNTGVPKSIAQHNFKTTPIPSIPCATCAKTTTSGLLILNGIL
ncbi:hypothetical protein HHI36_016987 [Cryptolaemus montrouzieri]|uniref:DUF4817 domain-containing protein n=1 Tax=Cryptolaemus montrouzieri TaxID=559131 RepID=A0ABD2NM16_9CUCU